MFGLVEAADFAGRVEELSRTVEYLQLIAAAAVDRTRKESASWPCRPRGGLGCGGGGAGRLAHGLETGPRRRI